MAAESPDMARKRTLDCQRARSDDIVNSLRDLRDQGDFYRVELFWNVQRSARVRRRSVAVQSFWSRRRALRLHDDQTRDEIFPYNLPPHAA